MDPLLKKLGWNAFFGQAFRDLAAGHEPGRVSTIHKNSCDVLLKSGEVRARVSGKLRNNDMYPAVGDWVAVSTDSTDTHTIAAILPRKSKVSRKDAGRVTGEQVIATNVDFAFIVTSLNKDLNLRRLERYLSIARQSGAEPVIVLNKADICENTGELMGTVKELAPDVPVYAISAARRTGLEQLSTYLQEGKTIALLGSSGVGKSSIINALEGTERQKVGEIREDDSRGRHVTTARELIVLEKGGVIIDNPGMRELQLWDAVDGLQDTFRDIEDLAGQCKFSDCAHQTEPGCAVKKALRDGSLAEVRLESYRKLQRELLAVERKKNPELMAAERKKWRDIAIQARGVRKRKEQGL